MQQYNKIPFSPSNEFNNYEILIKIGTKNIRET